MGNCWKDRIRWKVFLKTALHLLKENIKHKKLNKMKLGRIKFSKITPS